MDDVILFLGAGLGALIIKKIIKKDNSENMVGGGNNKNSQLNLNDKPLKICSTSPMTGYMRDGYCRLIEGDKGTHTVCAVMTDEFLKFTNEKGNDLSTRRKGFPGLQVGDKWCLCALRWKEAYDAGKAPKVDFNATNKETLKYVNLNSLRKHNLQVGGVK